MGAALSFSAAQAQSTWTESIVGGSNISKPGGITPIAFASSDGPIATASLTKSFTGMDGAGHTQTMTFSGVSTNSSQFGRLHSYDEGHLLNSYYNSANTPYANGGGGVYDENGTPDSLTSLGFAGFTDTLQYGGELQNGYKARYLFHFDGTNSGTGYLADLSVQIGDDPAEGFFASSEGYQSNIWATQDHEINGITPQQIQVQFSTQVVFDTFNLEDGGNYDGVSNFSSTVTLAGIEVRDANDHLVGGWTVTSGSGTVYPVPEPASLGALGVGLAALVRRRSGRGRR